MQGFPTQLTIVHPSFALLVPGEFLILLLTLHFFPRWKDKAAQLQGEVVATKLLGLSGTSEPTANAASVLEDKLG